MKSGIYQITIGEYFYFGHTRNLLSRKSQHICSLRNRTHSNRFMQRAYSKTGEFNFQIIKRCSAEDAVNIEQELITKSWGNPLLMNAVSDAKSSFACPTMREKTRIRNANRVWSDEAREKIRIANTGRPGNRSPRPTTTGPRNPNAKLSAKCRSEILDRRRSGELISDIAERFSVHDSTIQRICSQASVTSRPKSWTAKQRAAISSSRARNPMVMRRDCKGSKNSRAKLTEKSVAVIKSRLLNGCRLVDLASDFNVSPETIGAIKAGRNWSNIKPALIAEYGRITYR